jgi:Fur family ferric uptake transcriptional regulator
MRNSGVQGSHFATVYRAMPLLVEAGLLRTTPGLHGDPQRYEVAFERAQQPRLRCLSCGCVVEFQSRAIVLLQREIEQRFGFELDASASQLSGRCKKCQKASARGA